MLGLRNAFRSCVQHYCIDAVTWTSRRVLSSSRASSSVLWAQGVAEFPETVHIVDPRTLLTSDQGSKLSSVQMELPQTLLREAPTFELGDADDPMSSWIFGKGAEIFQYKFIGSVATKSGWVSILSQEAFRQVNSASSSGKAPQWEEVRKAAEDNDGLLATASPSQEQPFLFVGQILEAGVVTVYSKEDDGGITGLLIATGEEEIQTP